MITSGEIYEALSLAIRDRALEAQVQKAMKKAHEAESRGSREEQVDWLEEALFARSAQVNLHRDK